MAGMNKDYVDALQKCLEGLVKSLPSILDMLLVKMNTYFLDQQQEIIRTRENSVYKVVEFVNILRTMQDDAFFAFLNALDQLNYRHVADEIRLAANCNLPVPPPPQNSDAYSEGGNKKTKSIYPVMSVDNPPCAVIINNEKFASLKERSWSKDDVKKIKDLGKVVGIHFNIYNNLTAQQMKDALSLARSSLSEDTSGLLVFIMTHGTTDDRLYGSDDNNPISLKQLVELFESDKCPLLKDKPKIFIIHACRGDGMEPVETHPLEAHREGPLPTMDVTPRKADFLYIYSTTDGCVAYGQKQTGFISKLVDNLILKFNDKHLEDVLLDVKKEVASENYCEDGMYFKQMPSVVSQMRDRVWFAKY